MRLTSAAPTLSLRRTAALFVILLAALAVSLSAGSPATASVAPIVTAVAITSKAGPDATYAFGQKIRVTLTFSEAVNVSGTPQLAIDMDPADWGMKQAPYLRGTGSTELVFEHTVVEPNISTQGVAVLANSLALNSGSITSVSSGTAAALPHAGLAHDPNHKVNWRATAPKVTGVAITSDPGDDDTYARDDVIQVTLTFSEPVNVNGSPRVTIKMDPNYGAKRIYYSGGSGSTALTFSHTVVEPNISTAGVAVLADRLKLNGGTIRSVSSQTDVERAHVGLAHDPNHKVDWRLEPAPDCQLTAPSSVSALTIGRGAVVSWTLPGALSDVCQVTGFVVSAVNESLRIESEALIPDPEARSHTMRGLDPGDWVFSVRVQYAEGDSDEYIMLEANSVPDACITLAVEPYSRTGVSGKITSVNGSGCQAREMFDFEFKRSGNDYWTTYGKMPWSLIRQSDPNLPDFIAYHMEPNVAYDFRISAYDASNSKYVTSPASATIAAQDPSATADAGSPVIKHFLANNHGNIVLDWAGYAAPAGRTLTGFVVQWKTCSDPNDPAGCTGTAQSATQSASETRRRITGLTDGSFYTARVAARTHATNDHGMTTSDAWSVWTPALRTWSEPTQVWFETLEHVSGRLFLMSRNNKNFGDNSVCTVSDGSGSDPVNCPEGTLVHAESTGTIAAKAVFPLDGVRVSSTQSSGREGGPGLPAVFASGGNGTLVVEWDDAPVRGVVGSIDQYIVRHRSGTSGSWTNTVKGINDRSHTFTGLANGTWQVHVRARTDGDDGDPLTTDTPKLGFQSEILTVTLAAGKSTTVIPSRVKVFPGESQSLILEWELPASGSHPYAWQVRHRESGTTPWTESDTLFSRAMRRKCQSVIDCSNPRSHEIENLTGGTLYEVEVRVKNANGYGEWVGWSRRPND